MSASIPRLRCAVYTRKSTEEGLYQDFNSLDAQREACVAYIQSQAGLGWTLIPDRYDDGGISGGTMERPALQRMLQDIRDRRIDVVVVYKIDRLTRSLTDFSKIVEVFEGSGASFVSVTQQFNTTTSMGRLTLNVLLSFAQFEREVTAERIRDKIAASKQKGMWMGGMVPLGYRVENRKLVIEPSEAPTVRHLFDRYLQLGSVRALSEEAQAAGLKSRSGSVRKRMAVGKPFGRGNLYHLLSNPLYIGKVRHRDQLYQGEHEALIDEETFRNVQDLLSRKAPARSLPTNRDHRHLLTGILFDEAGDRLTSTCTGKPGKTYRYYVSSRIIKTGRRASDGWRLPAKQVEDAVEAMLLQLLADEAQLSDWIRDAELDAGLQSLLEAAARIRGRFKFGTRGERRTILQRVIQRVDLRPTALLITVDRSALLQLIDEDCEQHALAPLPTLAPASIELPITLKRRGVETKLVLSDGRSAGASPDAALIHLIGRAHTYLARLNAREGSSLTDVARACRTELSEVSRILPLAFLAPSITEAILAGRQPASLTAQRLLRLSDLPILWSDQTPLIAE